MNISSLSSAATLPPASLLPMFADDLRAAPAAAPLSEAVRQFEGVFAAMIVKELRQSIGGDGLIPGDHSDILGGLFDQRLGEHLASGRGLGLAESLSRLGPHAPASGARHDSAAAARSAAAHYHPMEL